MLITCPSCEFTQSVADDKIPPRSKVATCPQCELRFQFRELPDEPESAQKKAQTISQPIQTPTAPTRAPAQDSEPEQEITPEPPPYYGPDGRGLDKPQLDQPLEDQPEEHADDNEGLSAAERYLASKGSEADEPETFKNTKIDQARGPMQVEVPFEDLENFGFFAGMFHTIKRACMSPRLFFSVMPLKGLIRPFIFGLLVTEFMFIMTAFWQLTEVPSFSSMMMEIQGGQQLSPEETLNPMLLFLALPLVYLFNLLLNTLIAHGVLTLIGGAKRGFEGTFRVMAYSYAPLVLGFIPFGIIPAAFWSLAISVIGIKNMHSTDYGRTILAHLVIFVVLALLFFVPMGAIPPAVPPAG